MSLGIDLREAVSVAAQLREGGRDGEALLHWLASPLHEFDWSVGRPASLQPKLLENIFRCDISSGARCFRGLYGGLRQ